MMKRKLKKMFNISWQYIFFVVIWCGFLGGYNLLTIISGFVIIILISLLFSFSKQQINVVWLFLLIFYTIYKLIESSVFVMMEIFQKPNENKYDIKSVTFDEISNSQKVVLSNLISLTPGTLTIDVTNSLVVIHDMFSFKQMDVATEIRYKLLPLIKKAFPC